MNNSKKNISPSEICKFNNFSVDWWDRNGPMKSLHDINPLRLDYIRQQTPLKDKKVLDIGCGGGLLSEAMAGDGAGVTGIDASREMIRIARTHAEKSGMDIRYITTSVEDLKREESSGFDVIICMELLEHVPDPESVIRTCSSLLDPAGIIIFATLNRNPLAFLLAIAAAEYLLNLLPRGTHQYRSFIKPGELERACRSAGLKPVNFSGFSYNPVIRKYYLCSNTWVNYLAAFRPHIS